MSHAMIQHPVALMAFMLGVIAFSRALEKRYVAVQKISSAVVCTLLGIVLSNVGLIPHASPTYEGVNTYAIAYAIVLVILASDLRDLKVAGAGMMACFTLASVGSFAGGLLAGLAFTPSWAPRPGSCRGSSPERSSVAA